MTVKVCVLGSTGSVGRQALEVIEANGDLFEVVGLSSTGRNRELFYEQVERFSPRVVATVEKCDLPDGVEVITGEDSSVRLVEELDADIFLVALSGTAGILPTYAAVKKGVRVALANKESLVSAGYFIIEASRVHGSEIIPVDSEHSAIFQCLLGQDRGSLKRIILTASGGPFLNRPLEELDQVTPEEALAHPCWDMGPKITVDSATMMNKGLEVIEARWLFDLPPEKIAVLVHPQAIVHSMVEFVDNSLIAQLACPDMRIPISFALGFPARLPNPSIPLNLAGMNLTFEEPDYRRFPLLKLAYEALKSDRVLPVILNAADEVAVEAFLAGKIGFTGIRRVVEECMDRLSGSVVRSIEDAMELHKRSLELAGEVVEKIAGDF